MRALRRREEPTGYDHDETGSPGSPADVDVTWWSCIGQGALTGELVGRRAPHLKTVGPGAIVWVVAEAESASTLRAYLRTEAGCDPGPA
ncbi:siderophore-interacting protein [Gephyromycinifex aptenodytis]|uniref:siderophore-interacting protein n=1 Tax=Gephyromycinifex aptenodytis TaxID=2716227 RepID=UPI001447B89B|nr:siderophore-interacting protein [Gephyromycinifex aptenodytis]